MAFPAVAQQMGGGGNPNMMGALIFDGGGKNYKPQYIQTYLNAMTQNSTRAMEALSAIGYRTMCNMFIMYVPNPKRRAQLKQLRDYTYQKMYQEFADQKAGKQDQVVSEDEKLICLMEACFEAMSSVNDYFQEAWNFEKTRGIGVGGPFGAAGTPKNLIAAMEEKFTEAAKEGWNLDKLWTEINGGLKPVWETKSIYESMPRRFYPLHMLLEDGKYMKVPDDLDPVKMAAEGRVLEIHEGDTVVDFQLKSTLMMTNYAADDEHEARNYDDNEGDAIENKRAMFDRLEIEDAMIAGAKKQRRKKKKLKSKRQPSNPPEAPETSKKVPVKHEAPPEEDMEPEEYLEMDVDEDMLEGDGDGQ